MENANLALGIVGTVLSTAAWVSIIINFINYKKRKISFNVVDFRIIKSASATSSSGANKINGTIIMLGANIYVSVKSFFIDKMEIKIKLKDSAETKCELLDGEIIEKGGSVTRFINPNDYNFNLHREIICGKDNIRIIPIIAKNIDFNEIDQIEYIKFSLIDNSLYKSKKEVTIYKNDFPVYNHMGLICNCFEEQK